MPRIFVYEYLTGGGLYSDATASGPVLSLVGEGAAMVTALACDFQAIPGTEVVLLRDVRLPDLCLTPGTQIAIHGARQERAAFAELAAGCEWTVIIAPEQNHALLERTRWAESVQAHLLCPDSEFVAIASDKNRTADLLHRHGVPVPAGRTFRPGSPLPQDFCYPAVLKPADGAGSIGLQRLDDPTSPYDAAVLGSAARLETWSAGIAASVAVLCGPGGRQPLPPCLQRLSGDGNFRYLGGSAPIETSLAERAQRLAQAALACFPETQGYIGVDLVLGTARDGSGDVVVEVNPRLTTSYVGLRQLLKTNLAAAMIEAAAGRPVELCFARQQVEFTAEGRIS